MAHKTIRAVLMKLKQKFPHRTEYNYLYKNKSELTRSYTEIFTYSLIYDPERGHSIFICKPHRKGLNWKPPEWNKWLNEYFLDVLTHKIMEAINSKRGSNWQMMRFIGFHGADYSPPKSVHVVGEGKNALYQSGRKQGKVRNKSTKARK